MTRKQNIFLKSIVSAIFKNVRERKIILLKILDGATKINGFESITKSNQRHGTKTDTQPN